MKNVTSDERYAMTWLYFRQTLLKILSLILPAHELFCDWMMWEVLAVQGQGV